MTNPIHFTTAEEAVKVIKSGDHVHLSSVASAPQCLINAMCKRGEAGELKDVHVHHLHTEGPAPYADPKFEGVFQLDSFFVGANVRKVTQSGYADYIPIFLSETQRLYRCGAVPCNVAMIQVCPPDKHGFVSLGTSVDATLAAVECADYVIAVVNKYVPRAFGQAMIHSSKIDFFVQDDTPLIEAKFSEPNEVETAIGKHCAALIEDGATLQMGIGAIPNAVLSQLGGHKNLGIHTEMFADGVLPLVEKGVINGEAKKTDPGKMVSTFLMGSKAVYDFIDDNPGVLMMDVSETLKAPRVENLPDAVGRRRRGDDPQPHPLVRDRVRSRGPLRQDLAGACTPADLHRASFGAGGVGPGRFRALGIAPSLHQGIYEIAFPHLGNSNKKRRSHERRFLHLPANRPLIPTDGLPTYKPDAPRQRAA